MGYFHWTDEETYKEITRTGSLFQKVMTWIFDRDPHALVPGDGNAYYGEGIYFTDYGPSYARSTIAGSCFGHSSSTDQVQCYFEIEFHGNANIHETEKPHTYLLAASSNAVQNVVDHGYHEDYLKEIGDDDDDDDDDDWVPSCNKCDDSDDVSDPGGDYYWCSHCEHDIDNDGDCVTDPCSTCDEASEGECPVCEEEGDLITQDDDYDGQKIYICYECVIHFDESAELWPSDWDGTCRICQENNAASDCPKEQCGSCCDGNYCDRHG